MAGAGSGPTAAEQPVCWPQYVASWARADIATPSLDGKRIYGVSVGQGVKLRVTEFDSSRPSAVFEERWSDIGHLPAPESGKKSKTERGPLGMALPFAAPVRPIACAAVSIPARGDEDEFHEVEVVLVLLSSGVMILVESVRLGVEIVLAHFPEASDDHGSGPAIATLADTEGNSWVVVAEGGHLGYVPVDLVPSEPAGGSKASPWRFDLPKGCVTTAVQQYPAGGMMLLAGCSNGRILVYQASCAAKGPAAKLSFALLQTVGLSGTPAPAPTGRTGVFGLFRGGAGKVSDGDSSVTDMYVLESSGGDGLVLAAGKERSRPTGVLALWQMALDSEGAKKQAGSSHNLASCSTPTPVLRAVLVSAGHAGSSDPVVISLDRFADLTLWLVESGRFLSVRRISGRCAFEPAAARTFNFAGSVYMMVTTGSRSTAQVGWLDIGSLFASSLQTDRSLLPPLAGYARTCLGPPFYSASAGSASGAGAGAAVEVDGGGEVFFTSQWSLRVYNAASGRTDNVMTPGTRATGGQCRVLAVLDAFAPSPSVAATHLLVAVSDASAGPGVWLVSSGGSEVHFRAARAFDAALLGNVLQELRVVYLTRSTSGSVTASVAAIFGDGSSPSSVQELQVERVLRSPLHNAQLALFWGNGGVGSYLRLAAEPGSCKPSERLAVELPQSRPAELVDARWDTQSSGPWCLALSSAYAVWVVRFSVQQGKPVAGLIAYLDLRSAFAGSSRAFSIAWLRCGGGATVQGPGGQGVVLVSMQWGVAAWPVGSWKPPRIVALFERPQLLGGALRDRLICIEVQSGPSFFEGPDRPPKGSLWSGPRARVRTRAVNFLEVLAFACEDDPAPMCTETTNAAAAADWRLSPAALPSTLSPQVDSGLWPAASCSEAPPQLFWGAPLFFRSAMASRNEFKALAAIVCGLQSAGGRRNRGAGGEEEERAVRRQVEEFVWEQRINPARLEALHVAAMLALSCAPSASNTKSASGLRIATSGLAKHDLLPLGGLLAAVLRATPMLGERDGGDGRSGLQRLVTGYARPGAAPIFLPSRLASSVAPGSGHGAESQAHTLTWHWTGSLSSSSPLAAALLAYRAGVAAPPPGAPAAVDLSAAALVSQPYADAPPTRTPPQKVLGKAVCQLHTATTMQWLGLGSTELLVRVFRAIQHEATVEASPAASTRHLDSRPSGLDLSVSSSSLHPIEMLPNGLLIYWRCADGAGLSLRDSGGSGRIGRFRGTCQWAGALPADDPLESTDEWGTSLAPNCAVAFGNDGEIRYTPAQGTQGERDRQMLNLIGGVRSDATAQVVDAVRRNTSFSSPNGDIDDDDGDVAASTVDGWTVELWLRLRPGATGDMRIFARQGAASSLSWLYKCDTASFLVSASGQPPTVFRCGAGRELGVEEWTHVALRSDLTTIQVWLNDSVLPAVSAASSIPPVESNADVIFGPAVGLEITEVRVWGVWKSDWALLDHKWRPLPTLLDVEKRVEGWKKVKIRANPAGNAGIEDGQGNPGLWGLADLMGAPAPTGGRKAGRKQKAQQQQPLPTGLPMAPSGTDAHSPWESGASPWGPVASVPGAWGGAESSPWPQSGGTPSGGAGGFAPSSAWAAAATAPAAPRSPMDARVPPSPPFQHATTPVATSIVPPPTMASLASPRTPAAPLAMPTSVSQQPTARSGNSDASDNDSSPSGTGSSPPISPCASPPLPAMSREAETSSNADYNGLPVVLQEGTPIAMDQFPPIRSRPDLLRRLPWATPVDSSRDIRDGDSAGVTPMRNHGDSTASLSSPRQAATSLQEILPIPAPEERDVVLVVDQSLRVGAKALEANSHSFAAAAFRMALGKLVRQLPMRRGLPEASLALKARLQAAAAYGVLCGLLLECEELRERVRNARHGWSEEAQALLGRICVCWACVLRVAKAPRHTVFFAVQAMAMFFTDAQMVGGWAAAQQLASVLLLRCRPLLSAKELQQVQYVEQATAHGAVARGVSAGPRAAAICGSCPRCQRPLQLLAPRCGTCGAEVSVCFHSRRLCDAAMAAECNLCSATVGPPHAQAASRRPQGGGAPQPVRSSPCFVCGVGELRPRHFRSASEVLAY